MVAVHNQPPFSVAARIPEPGWIERHCEAPLEVRLLTVLPGEPLRLPGGRLPEAGIEDGIDCNSPLHWDAAGNLYLFASVQHPFRSEGIGLLGLIEKAELPLSTSIHSDFELVGGMWLEATYRDEDGTLYGWYHNEISAGCENEFLTVPRIGALISHDEGVTWEDLGIVLQAPTESFNCGTQNFFFAGGNGDFTVLLDRNKEYFYFYYGSYDSQVDEQGICVARQRYEDRNEPVGKAWKWRDGAWGEPGLNGRGTPFIAVNTDWHSAEPDAYWGPSVHYNSYLEQYVMLLNHALDSRWYQEGVYLSYNRDLTDPLGWSTPERLPLDPEGRAYPQVIGLSEGETDKLAGRSPRLFIQGDSLWQLDFKHPGEPDSPAPLREPSETRNMPERFPGFRSALTDLPARINLGIQTGRLRGRHGVF
ncbi:MAG: hypothetical protein HYR56_32310, partial [Acidobacteria bacterium]|nr:hypothetical protein [Acidobacteriota bacterium]